MNIHASISHDADDAISLNIAKCLSHASFWTPNFINLSAWIEHGPFGFWLMDVFRPRTFVELGTHEGFSFFVFCQAVQRLRIDTQCYAIDTWKGDVHAGFYAESVYERISKYHSERYSKFSTLIRSTFDEAVVRFEDASIDLLHIDGRHSYEDVKHDFEVWLPKLSNRAVVLFHDTDVKGNGFGVFKYWGEVKTHYPHFEFIHGNGLGVLGVGSDSVEPLSVLFSAAQDANLETAIRGKYRELGLPITERMKQITKINVDKRSGISTGVSTTPGVEIAYNERNDQDVAWKVDHFSTVKSIRRIARHAERSVRHGFHKSIRRILNYCKHIFLKENAAITVITCAYNESVLAPLFFKHYAFASRIIVLLDADTTDNTADIARTFENVEIYPLVYPDGLDDDVKMDAINWHYSQVSQGYVLNVDMDEFVFIEDLNYSMYEVNHVELYNVYRHCSESDISFDTSVKLQRRHGVLDSDYRKPILARAGQFLRWHPGNHAVSIFRADGKAGMVTVANDPLNSDKVLLNHNPYRGAHWANADLDFCINRRVKNRRNRLSANNIERGYGVQYFTITEADVIRECEAHDHDPELW